MGNLVSQTTTGAYDLALEYAYDLSGRMTKESRTENGTTLESSYIYDALGQLTEFTRSDDIAESYTYDAVGNMLTKTAGGVKTKYTYNAGNQLVSDGENKYAYDKNGNLVQKGNTRYTYNALNLLESWTDGQTTETYSYNANGLLRRVTNNEGTTDLTWDILMGDGVVISANTNGVETNYSYGLERISAQTGNRKTEYVYDGRGSVAAEVSYNSAWYTLGGTLSKKDVVSKSYTPFGEQIGEQTSGFGYNGEYYNAATGMVYLRARFYEPEMNRFSQKDVIRGSVTAPGSLNRYTYVQNDPINFIDPSGQTLKTALKMVGSKISSAVKKVVSHPVQAAKSVGKAIVNAVTRPVKTVKNAAKSIGNAVKAVYKEVKTPESQSKYASPTKRGTSSGSSYSGPYGGGAYGSYTVSPMAYGPYDSNSNVYSYYNSSFDTGKIPSTDAPRIKNVTEQELQYCNNQTEETTSKYGDDAPGMYTNALNAGGSDLLAKKMREAAREKYNENTVNVYFEGEGSDIEGQFNLRFYRNENNAVNVHIEDSLSVTSIYEQEAILEVLMESSYYSEEKYGTKDHMLAQWRAHNDAYDLATSMDKIANITGIQSTFEKIYPYIFAGSSTPLESSKELDLREVGNTSGKQDIIYDIYEKLGF